LLFGDLDRSLLEIADAIEVIGRFTQDMQDMDFNAFSEDPKLSRPVERKLQIISEAAIRVGPEAETPPR